MSVTHLILLMVILLLVFGPSRIEGIGTSLGKAVRGFKKGLEGQDTPSTTTTLRSTEEKKSEPTA